jgi:hypothetical protein
LTLNEVFELASMRLRPILFFIVTAGIAAGTGALVAWAPLHRPLLMVLLAILIPAPIVLRVAQGRFDPFEPISLLSLGLFVMFVLRPIANLQYDRMTQRAIPLEPGFDQALLAALVGTVALYGGYFASNGRRLAQRLRPIAATWDTTRAAGYGTGLLLLAVVLLAVFAVRSGGVAVLQQYLTGRSEIDSQLYRGTTAYVSLGPQLAIPAALILIVTHSRRKNLVLLALGMIAVALALLLSAPRGDRIFVLALVLPLVALPYLRRDQRPRALATLAFLLISLVLVSSILEFRDDERRSGSFIEVLAQSATSPGDQWKKLTLGPDTLMFTNMALLPESDPTPYPGVTVTSMLAGPIPGTLWSEKPKPPDVYFYRSLFPQQAAKTDSGESLSMLGGFYYDMGYGGLILFAGLVGIFWRTLYEYLMAHRANSGVQLVYAACLPFVLILLRGTPTDSLGRAVFLVLPIIVGLWWSSRAHRVRAGGTSLSPLPQEKLRT